MTYMKQIIGIAIALACSVQSHAQVTNTSDQNIRNKVEKNLSRLTLEEKVLLCHGSGTMTLSALPKAGIDREFQMSDNSSSIRPDLERLGWGSDLSKTATAFPSLSALAATWDRELAFRMGDAMGKEARARGKDMLLGPGINIHRTPLCGRNWEYFGEDPTLTSKLVVPYIHGVQTNDVAATAKHFALNNQELARFSYNAEPDERTLREIYLPAWEAAVKEGYVLAVMNAYNLFRGSYCSHNDYLNNQILKGEWGFQGLVVTDWGGMHDTVKAALGGTDIEMNNGQKIQFFKQPLIDAVRNGDVPESVVDDKARRILYVMEKIKLIDEPSTREKGEFETPEHTELARIIAEQSITLLKNEGAILPLNPKKIRKLLVVGDNATALQCRGGGSAQSNPKHEVSPLEGIKELLGNDVDVRFHQISSDEIPIRLLPSTWVKTYDPDSTRIGLGQPAFKAEYFANTDLSGEPTVSRYDIDIDFDWSKQPLPEGLSNKNFSVRWTATISPEEDGEYTLAALMDDGARVYVDDQLLLDSWQPGAQRMITGSIELKKGTEYSLRIDYFQLAGEAQCQFGLTDGEQSKNRALAEEAAAADAVVFFTGNNHQGPDNIETENEDRKDITLPEKDNRAIATVLDANPNTVIVNLSGSGVAMPWINQAPAVVQYYFSGQEGGHAIANVLFGKVNPSGKLPFTMPVALSDSPAHALNDYNEKEIRYAEGVFVGYRWFDEKQIEPLFPFGHGLSYTTFRIDEPICSAEQIQRNQPIEVRVPVTNTGKMAGAETVQLYIAPPPGPAARPPRELKDFGKVFLQPGETQEVILQLTWRDLAYWDMDSHGWNAEPGTYQIEIGTSSRNIHSSTPLLYKPIKTQ